MSAVEDQSIPDEENYYRILEVPNTATLTEIRNAYEEKLEEAHLEAIAAYSLFPEEETEEKLLHYSQAFVALANPIARAKYDNEIQQSEVPLEKKVDSKKETASEKKEIKKRKKSEIIGKNQNYNKNELDQTEENVELTKSAPEEVVGQTQEERQNFYLNLATKNELSEDSLEEYYSRLTAHGGKISFNGAVLKQIRELKAISIEELSKITCIRSTYLKAIEEENFKKFTSGIYLKGYLLCYLESMNLPSEKIIEDYFTLYKNYHESKNS
tara:strand:- start:184 stop:993 length:810 start_codon:yes stop_codon:yes gene_type:complete